MSAKQLFHSAPPKPKLEAKLSEALHWAEMSKVEFNVPLDTLHTDHFKDNLNLLLTDAKYPQIKHMHD